MADRSEAAHSLDNPAAASALLDRVHCSLPVGVRMGMAQSLTADSAGKARMAGQSHREARWVRRNKPLHPVVPRQAVHNIQVAVEDKNHRVHIRARTGVVLADTRNREDNKAGSLEVVVDSRDNRHWVEDKEGSVAAPVGMPNMSKQAAQSGHRLMVGGIGKARRRSLGETLARTRRRPNPKQNPWSVWSALPTARRSCVSVSSPHHRSEVHRHQICLVQRSTKKTKAVTRTSSHNLAAMSGMFSGLQNPESLLLCSSWH